MSQQLEQLIRMPIYKSNLEVTIKQDTKEGIGLIDHDYTDNFPLWKFKVSSSSIYKDNQTYQEGNVHMPHKNQLLQINKLKNQYEIALKSNQETFVVVKDLKAPQGAEYPLTLNAMIRLGRVEFHVIEERTSAMQTFYAQSYTKNIQIEDADQVYQCRFCFMEGRQSADSIYLTNICRCQGNSQAVHLECLKYWIDQNVIKEETQFGLVLKWTKAFECYVCKDILPTRICYQKQYYDLFTLDRPDMQYLILQNINREKNVCTEMYLIHSLLQDVIKIGRAFTCDIKAQDITVSRHHASIKIVGDQFVITDNKSKFGTLVSMNQQALLIDCTSCSLQQGKLLIQFAQLDYIHKSSPSTQHKLTQLPQINKLLDEDEPQMDDDSLDNYNYN